MKKGLIFLLTLLVASSVMAQTFEESQKLVISETVKMEKRLDEINDRIYYLAVILNERIIKASAQYLPKLQKEKFFAKEDSVRLTAEKKIIEKTLLELKSTGLSGLDYRTKSDEKTNVPLKMSTREFNRRSRSQSYRALEGSYNGTSESKKFEGVLINYKTGRNDILSFSIYRTDVKSKPIGSFMLNPQERLKVELLPGKYNVAISDGVRIITIEVKVDPLVKKYADGGYVYWFAYGNY